MELEGYEECQKDANNKSRDNCNKINSNCESCLRRIGDLTMDNSCAKDCSLRKLYERHENGKNVNSYPHYVEVTSTNSEDSLPGRVCNAHPYHENSRHGSMKNAFKSEPSLAIISICANKLYRVHHTGMEVSKDVCIGENPRGTKDCVRGPCGSNCYFEHKDLLVKDINDETVISPKSAQTKSICVLSSNGNKHSKSHSNLQSHNSNLHIDNASLQTGSSSLQNSNLSLQTGNLCLQTANSSLQAGYNRISREQCKHGVPSSKKSNSEDGLCCRICHSVNDLEALVSPCLCTGSMKYVHESCLLNWLKSSVKTNCELCLHEVPVKKLLKPLRKWRILDEKPVAIIWLLSFLILLTLNILSVIKDASRGCTSTACVVFYVLGCTGIVLGVIFLWFWAKKSAVYFKKFLLLNQVWLLDKEQCRRDDRARTFAVNCNA